MTRRLVLSDTHFGDKNALLAFPVILERIEPELEWAEELILDGDIFEFLFSSVKEAITAARPFFSLVQKHIDKITYIPGNHDHHLIAMTFDEHRFAHSFKSNDHYPFRARAAERVIEQLCPGVEVRALYPLVQVGDVAIIHGHYFSSHHQPTAGLGWRLLDNLQWRLTGDKSHHRQLTLADYEALIAPLYELIYQTSQLPSGRQSHEQNERLLRIVGAVVQAPGKAAHQALKIKGALGKRLGAKEKEVLFEPPEEAPVDRVIAAMTAVCQNLDIPSGPVIFGHSHHPLSDVSSADGRWHFYNPSSWLLSNYERQHPEEREHTWPGGVIRITDNQLELRRLLQDFDLAALERLVDSVDSANSGSSGGTRKKRRRLLRRTN